MTRAMIQTRKQLNTTLPLELISRYISYNTAIGNYTCEPFLTLAGMNETYANTICSTYKMDEPHGAQFYIKPMWYGEGSYGYDLFQRHTEFTDEQMQQYFDVTNPHSFATKVIDQNGLNAIQWDCASTTNCTAEEISSIQWGSSDITYNPRFYGDIAAKYIPRSYSINDWGDYKV